LALLSFFCSAESTVYFSRAGQTFLIREYARGEIIIVCVRGEGGGESELQGCKNGFFFVVPAG